MNNTTLAEREDNEQEEATTPAYPETSRRPTAPNVSNPVTSPRGRGIPRLQELSFLEVAALEVKAGSSFEMVRKRLVAHMIELRRSDARTGHVATFRLAQDDPKRYVRNTTESLKELMRLGLVASATLPSSTRAARSYVNTTFSLTEAGRNWTSLLRTDLKAAYDDLLRMLWQTHPQFEGFLRAITVDRSGLVVPLAQWGELPLPRTRDRYMRFLADQVAKGVVGAESGWSATASEILATVEGYIETIRQSAHERGRSDPHPRNQDFVKACEEAVVKFAFRRCGVPLAYISHEILRRWTKELGVASFSYHVPGVTALRIWPTADLVLSGNNVSARRRTGREQALNVVKMIRGAYDQVRKEDPARSLWVPVYRVRAAVCSRLMIPDAVFDRALIQLLQGDHSGGTFGINIDPAQYGVVPIINENDVVAADEIGEIFGDNDRLSSLIAALIDADLLIILSDVDGLYTADPGSDPTATRIETVDSVDDSVFAMAGEHRNAWARGGMPTKLHAAHLVTTSGIAMAICRGRNPEALLRVARGEPVGTFFKPARSKLEARKRWMLSRVGDTDWGQVIVDDGAVAALRRGAVSLLPAGVRNVVGDFTRGDIIYVSSLANHHVACGIANYSAADVERIQGMRSDRIVDTLGYHYGQEVIHRNNLVLL